MKHAILITAYKDFTSLEQLVKKFDNNFTIYIHFDKKSKASEIEIQNILRIENVKCFEKKYCVNWGGLNHLKSYLFLCEKALENPENHYFHLITGDDYPLKNNSYFNKFLLNDTQAIVSYMDYFKLPSTEWDNGGMNRLEHYNFFDVFNAKSAVGIRSIRFLQNFQKKLNIKRTVNFKEQLYGGSTYWSLSRSVLQYVINFTNGNPNFLNRFRFTFCAEEIYFQTVIMNSEHSEQIINDNLRFIDFESGKGGYPAFLDEDDFEILTNSNKLFGRKIVSSKLKEMLTIHVNQNEKRV